MTANDLRKHFAELANLHGLEYKLPDKMEVDSDTYANICQEVFDWTISNRLVKAITGYGVKIEVILGQNNGIMFKGVELILKR